jgi:hypothetical protein
LKILDVSKSRYLELFFLKCDRKSTMIT